MGCRMNKIPFASRKEANDYIRGEGGSTNRKKAQRGSLSAYECPFCGDWHITSLPKKTVKSLKKRGVIM